MKPLSYFAAASKQVTTHPTAMLKLEAALNTNITDGLFLQIHDSRVVPAEGAAPLKSWPASDCGYKEFKNGELRLTVGLYLCLSTTAATKTLAAGGSDLIDELNVELECSESPSGTTYVGDLTTGVTSRQIWAEAAGPKKLISLEVDGTGLNAAAFIMLFAKDNPADGDRPIMQWPLADNQQRIGANALKFGEKGVDVYSVDTAERKGCTVAISSTTGVLTTIVAQTCTIKGEYR